MYPVQFATEEINAKRIAQAAEMGTTEVLMKAFSKLAGDNNFLHGRSEATGGVPLRYHECRKENAAIERRLEDLGLPEDLELAAMWECHGSGTPASQTLQTMSTNSMACLGLTQEQVFVTRYRTKHAWKYVRVKTFWFDCCIVLCRRRSLCCFRCLRAG